MASKLGWIIVIVLLSNKISFASSASVKAGTFQYLHRHPKLRSCADKVLKENLYVGGRVHMLTGECEGLNRSWVFNQTVQSGYAYTKKVSAKEILIPPLAAENELVGVEHFTWVIPGVLREGALVEIVLEWSPGFLFEIFLFERLEQQESEVRDWISMIYSVYRSLTGGRELLSVDLCGGLRMTPGMKHTISLRAHTGSFELLVDDRKSCMYSTGIVDVTTLWKIEIALYPHGFLHSVKFIDA